MTSTKPLFAAGVLLLFTAACGSGTLVRYASVDTGALRPQRSGSSSDYLYVANDGNGACYSGAPVSRINVYEPNATKLQRQFGVSTAPELLAVDGAQNLYAASEQLNAVAVYPPGGSTATRTITDGLSSPDAMLVDSQSNLYVANYYGRSTGQPNGWIVQYAPGSSSPARTIDDGIDHPNAIAIDSQQNVFVSNAGSNAVTIYGIGATTPNRTITDAIENPSALLIDPSDELLVANQGHWNGGSFTGSSIAVYAPNASTPAMRIIGGVASPVALALDGANVLYVANAPPNYSGAGSISEYAAGSSTLLRRITKGIDQPSAMLFDSKGDLYVLNKRGAGIGSVTVYAPRKTTPERTIATDLCAPQSIVLSTR